MAHDDDDWTGTPPEGRHARDRADPGHWQRQWGNYQRFFGVLGILVVVVIVAIIF